MVESSWESQAAEGETLAADVGAPAVDARLLALLLDPENTAVTLRTALALLEQRSHQAVQLLVRASARADDNHNDWIGDAIVEFRARHLGDDDDFLRGALSASQNDPDQASAKAARDLAVWCGFA